MPMCDLIINSWREDYYEVGRLGSPFRRCGLYRRHIERSLTDVVTLRSGYTQFSCTTLPFVGLQTLATLFTDQLRDGHC